MTLKVDPIGGITPQPEPEPVEIVAPWYAVAVPSPVAANPDVVINWDLLTEEVEEAFPDALGFNQTTDADGSPTYSVYLVEPQDGDGDKLQSVVDAHVAEMNQPPTKGGKLPMSTAQQAQASLDDARARLAQVVADGTADQTILDILAVMGIAGN